MGRLLYNLIMHLGLLILGPLLLVVMILTDKRRASFLERLGIVLPLPGKKAGSDGHVWIHALSVGEFRSAEPLIEQMTEKYGEARVVLTTSTVTGQKIARQRYGGKVRAIGYFPYDVPWTISRVLQRINPQLVVLVESDLWPNFIAMVNDRKIPIIWANARISTKSFQGYRRFKAIVKPMFNRFDAIGVQTDADAEKLYRLGVSAEKVTITGNIKFDQPAREIGADWIRQEKQKIGWSENLQVLLAGSTHAGEENQLIEIFKKIVDKKNAVGLMMVPRDPNRAEAIAQMGIKAGLETALYGELNANGLPPDMVVVDRMGLLRDLYALADVAFIGGSLVPIGGHNPIEAAALGKPLLWGPNMHNFSAMASAFIKAGAAHEISGPETLEKMAVHWLNDSVAARAAGEAGRELVRQNRGSVAKIMTMVEGLYEA